jgi:hypothetical protein
MINSKTLRIEIINPNNNNGCDYTRKRKLK